MAFDLETVIAATLLLMFGWVVWKGGSNNPVGTGALQRQLNTIGSKVGKIETALQGTCSKADLEVLRGEINEIEARTASSGEVTAMEVQIAALRGEVQAALVEVRAAVKAADRTEAGVQRIEGYFLQRGING